LRELVERRLAEIRALIFQEVHGLPPEARRRERLDGSEVEISESLEHLPSGRLLVRIRLHRISLWRRRQLVCQAGMLFSSTGYVREVTEEELNEER
jgi:hypothetical protein